MFIHVDAKYKFKPKLLLQKYRSIFKEKKSDFKLLASFWK